MRIMLPDLRRNRRICSDENVFGMERVPPKQLPDSQAHLHGIDSRIGGGQSCIGNMHIPQLNAEVAPGAKNTSAQCRLIHKVDCVGAVGNIVVGEKNSAGQFEEWRQAPTTLEIPFERQGIESCAVSGISGLECDEDRDGIDRVFKSSAKNARKMRGSENPSIAQASVENCSVPAAARNGVAAPGPDFDLVRSLFRRTLGD